MVDRMALAGLIAALLHDVRKMDLDNQGQWTNHEDLSCMTNPYLQGMDFPGLLGQDVVDIIAAHHDPSLGITAASWDEARNRLMAAMAQDPLNRPKIALAMADRWQKAMYGVEKSQEFDRLRQKPMFVPFWGDLQEWDQSKVTPQLQQVVNALSAPVKKSQPGYPRNLNLQRLLGIQEYMRGFPHTTYIPHIPLSVHHRFTAILYLFIYRRLSQVESPLDLQGLEFSLIRITPDPLLLLYRLRDVSIAHKEMRRLHTALAQVMHGPYRSLIPDLSPRADPFAFFSEDDLILVTDRPDEVLNALKEFVNGNPEVSAVSVEHLRYQLPKGWKLEGGRLDFYADVQKVKISREATAILGNGLTRFPSASLARCQRCGRPISGPPGGEETLCESCNTLRQSARGGPDLEQLAAGDLLGFVFLAFPDALRPHAGEVARDKLILQFTNRRWIPPGLIRPSPHSFFEYLTALEDLTFMWGALDEERKAQARKGPQAASLFITSTLMAWVLRWDLCWKFIGRLQEERRRLALDSSLTVVFAHPDFPFWSLMDQYARYRGPGADWYFDTTGRSVVMFTREEVNQIRRLAQIARERNVSNTELEGLVQTALLTDSHELFLEIDARRADGKLGGKEFPGELKKALETLNYANLTPQQQRQKRAVFIKYIRKLKGGS